MLGWAKGITLKLNQQVRLERSFVRSYAMITSPNFRVPK